MVEKQLKDKQFNIGDTVQVLSRLKEGDKERITKFEGVVIAFKGKDISRTFTVRRVTKGGYGMERIFPLHSPLITQVKVVKQGKARRSKLYYLRQRSGKAATAIKKKSE